MEEVKLCECGCGKPTTISMKNCSRYGWVKGKPKRFIRGHAAWRGGKGKTSDGKYDLTYLPSHPRAAPHGYVLSHILEAEKALGKPLPIGVEVHHFDSKQLVICQDKLYHFLLHKRHRAFLSCGNVHWRKCRVCHKYDAIELLIGWKRNGRDGDSYAHRECDRLRRQLVA